MLWSNLPEDIDAASIARLYRKRWRIEGMCPRLESVLHSEIKSLGHPRAALLGFAVAVLAYNVLALLKRVTEQAHRASHPELDVSTCHLTVEIASQYEGMMAVLPPEHLPRADDDPAQLLLHLAARLKPRQLATSKRAPKPAVAKGYVVGSTPDRMSPPAACSRQRSKDVERGGSQPPNRGNSRRALPRSMPRSTSGVNPYSAKPWIVRPIMPGANGKSLP